MRVGTDAAPPTVMSRSLSLACAAGDERVRQHDGPGAGPSVEVGPHALHRGGQHGRVAALVAAQLEAYGVGLEVGHGVDRHRAGGVVEQDRPVRSGDVGAQVDAGRVDQGRAEAEAAGRVVVAADEHDPGAGAGQPRRASSNSATASTDGRARS